MAPCLSLFTVVDKGLFLKFVELVSGGAVIRCRPPIIKAQLLPLPTFQGQGEETRASPWLLFCGFALIVISSDFTWKIHYNVLCPSTYIPEQDPESCRRAAQSWGSSIVDRPLLCKPSWQGARQRAVPV